MHIVLLSGGAGRRLWPLSNEIRSKQFLKIFRNTQGDYESMIQRMYRQVRSICPQASITVAASKAQVPAIRNQLGGQVDICLEPCRKDTFPAIALAAAYLQDKKGVLPGEAVVACPVDPYVEDSYFLALKELAVLAAKKEADLLLLGIQPEYPSEKYGYILPKSSGRVSIVQSFQEKPDKNKAESYIQQGALWNGGVFAFQLGYALKKAHGLIDFSGYMDLLEKYGALEKSSFDYAVTERESNAKVLRFDGCWKDLGTWNTLTEAMEGPVIGNAVLSGSCRNVHVVNSLDIPILCMGLEDTVVSAGPDGILVSEKEASSYMKPYVEQISPQVRYAEKSWGSYQVLDVGEESLTIKVVLKQGCKMNYHSHGRREEVWTVLSGRGSVVLDGVSQAVGKGDIVKIPVGCRHTMIAETELEAVEVQLGKDIHVSDKKKYRFIHYK